MTTAPVTASAQGPGGLRGRGGLRMTPGRWVALLFGVPAALALIGWTGFGFASDIGRASFPVSTTFAVRDGHLTARLGGGDFTVRQDRALAGQARLAGTVQYSLVRPRLTVSGTGVSLDCRIPAGNCGLSGTLDVPAGTAVDLTSGGGNMQVNGLQSDITLNSGGGDVTLSGDGTIADVSTGGGNLTASDLGGIVQFRTGGGDVSANGLFAPQVDLESGGGNVTLVFTSVPTSVTILSEGGDVTLVLPHGSTRYAITAVPDGGDFGASVPRSPASPHTINVQSGGGNISIAEAG